MHDPGSELVDIVDDAGTVVGTATRREMRARNLPHRVTYVLVFHPDGRPFVHLRTPTKDIYPSHWDVTAGGVAAAGESFDDGARRNSREELGVEAALTPLFPFRYADDRTGIFGFVYAATHAGPFALQPEEIVRGEFVPPDGVEDLATREPFAPVGLAVWREYLRTKPRR